jgi:O-antigen/teichoic acid export membrane protein
MINHIALQKKLLSSLISQHSIKATAFAGMFVQISRPLVSMLTLPPLLSYLELDGFGIWMIALSILGLMGLANSGLSAALVTAIGRLGEDFKRDKIKHLVLASTILAFSWSAILLIVGIPVVLFIDWADLLHLSGNITGNDVSKLMIALVIMQGCGFLANISQQVMRGLSQGVLAHALNFLGVIAGAIGLIVAIYLKAPLWQLGLAFMGPTLLISFFGGLVYFHYSEISLFSLRSFDWPTTKWLAKDSLRMAGYHSAFAVSSQSDLLLIGMILGSSATAAYGIAHRVFSFILIISSVVSQAQWPVMASWDAASKHAVVGKSLKQTVVIGVLTSTTIALIIALFYEPLIRLWLGKYITTNWWIISGMIAWVFVATLVNIFDSVLRARHETPYLMRSMFFMAVINIAFSLVLIPLIGAGGAIWGSVLGYGIALAIPYSFRLWGLYGKYW